MAAVRTWGQLLAALASIGLCLPAIPVAAQQATVAAPAANVPAPMVRDVELKYGGLLVGRLLDPNGRPLANQEVSILAAGKVLAATRSDAEGVFAVSSLRGGVHQINTTDIAQVCRLWTNGTAPPEAPQSIEIVSGQDLVRGQYGPPPGNRMWQKAKVWATNPFVVGGIVAAAVAIPVALADDNDGPRS